jgi:hypothetical protein
MRGTLTSTRSVEFNKPQKKMNQTSKQQVPLANSRNNECYVAVDGSSGSMAAFEKACSRYERINVITAQPEYRPMLFAGETTDSFENDEIRAKEINSKAARDAKLILDTFRQKCIKKNVCSNFRD